MEIKTKPSLIEVRCPHCGAWGMFLQPDGKTAECLLCNRPKTLKELEREKETE